MQTRDLQSIIIMVIMALILIMLVKKRDKMKLYYLYLVGAVGITLLVDIAAFYIRFTEKISSLYINYLYLYGMLLIFFFILFLMYQKVIINKRLKIIARIVTYAFVISYIVNLFFVDLEKKFPDQLLMCNVFLLLVMVTTFLLDTFKSDWVLNIRSYYLFWFSIGLIIVQVAIIPPIIISNNYENTIASSTLLTFIIFIIQLIGYGIMLFGLLFSEKSKISSQ